jgi:hypothetical protein
VETTAAGRINGVISRCAVLLLRTLATRFLNRRSGLCCPSYAAMAEASGFCRQTVTEALASLEGAGLLKITRRLCRRLVTRRNPQTGLVESYMGTVQDTSLYSLHMPGAWAEHMIAPPRGGRYRFPAPRQLTLLQRGALAWTVQPSLGHREETTQPPTKNGVQHVAEAIAALRASVERAGARGFSVSGCRL